MQTGTAWDRSRSIVVSGRDASHTVVLDGASAELDNPTWTSETTLASSDGRDVYEVTTAGEVTHLRRAETSVSGLAFSPTADPGWLPLEPFARETDLACGTAGVSSDFDDVGPTNTQRDAIACLGSWSATQGIGDNLYAPGEAVTRAQMATFVARTIEASGLQLDADAPDAFTDVGGIHADAVTKLAAAGIVGSAGSGTASNRRHTMANTSAAMSRASSPGSGNGRVVAAAPGNRANVAR